MESRRRLLSMTKFALVSFAATTLAGCSTTPSSPHERVAIDSIEVTNQDDVQRQVTVRVSDGDDDAVRFEESVSVDAGESRALESPVDARGAYSIVATMDDVTVEEEVVAFANEDDFCVLPVVRVEGGDLFVSGHSYSSC